MAITLALHKLLLMLLLTVALCPGSLKANLRNVTVNYVTPNASTSCPTDADHCLTLDEYVLNSTDYFVSDSHFKLLQGIHHLSLPLTVSNCSNMTFEGVTSQAMASVPRATVCANSSGIVNVSFTEASRLSIKNLAFHGCLESPEPSLLLSFEAVSDLAIDGLYIKQQNFTLYINASNGTSNVSNIHYHMVSPIPLSYTHLLASLVSLARGHTHSDTYFTNIVMKGSPVPTNGISIYGCPFGLIEISDVLISDCLHVGLQVYDDCGLYDGPGSVPKTLKVEDTVIRQTSVAVLVQPLAILGQWFEAIIPTNIVFVNTTFEYNQGGAIVAYRVKNLTFIDSTFRENTETALVADQSYVHFIGNISFINNTGLTGGAIALYNLATLWFPEPSKTTVNFSNNTATHVGGAIYASLGYWGNAFLHVCFIQISEFPSDGEKLLSFEGNVAEDGGDNLYGVQLNQRCIMGRNTTVVAKYFRKIMEFLPPYKSNTSLISSDPIRVHHCAPAAGLPPNCSDSSTASELSLYPGEYFSISAMLVGDLCGMVRGPIYTNLMQEGNAASNFWFVDGLQVVQEASVRSCTKLRYSILANPTTVQLVLSPYALSSTDVSSYNNKDSVLNVTVEIKMCPKGFSPNGDPPMCVCNYKLTKVNASCNITEHVIYRQGNIWIGNYGIIDNSTGEVVFGSDCPFQYCRQDVVAIPTDPVRLMENAQCQANHAGILCGRCLANHSLALGSNRCLPDCSNRYLLLLLAFAVAGPALVFFVKMLDFTVAEGTINGLILFANIVGADPSLYYPTNPTHFTAFLAVFISWLNLDLGIETCFFNGLDAYGKAWLQFAFPAYILVIAIVIIYSSHYSTRISRIFGGNSVPVLATLILLSYSKLLRATLSALSLAELESLSTNSTVTVWRVDGNIKYLRGKHIAFFVTAIAILVFLWLPFTLLLTLQQWVQRSRFRLLSWVLKLRPFFDAYTGPFKSRHRYWVGVLLLARCLVLLVFCVSASSRTATTLVSTVFVVTIGLTYLTLVGCVYRNIYLYALECSYILNLGVLSAGSLYVTLERGNQAALVDTSVGIVFFQFVLTVGFHVFRVVSRACVRWQGKKLITRSVFVKRDSFSILNEISTEESESCRFRESLFNHM